MMPNSLSIAAALQAMIIQLTAPVCLAHGIVRLFHHAHFLLKPPVIQQMLRFFAISNEGIMLLYRDGAQLRAFARFL